ncbi:MAG: O-antigen ligase family protein [Bacteroidota bacterium]
MNSEFANPSLYGETNLDLIYAYFGLAFLMSAFIVYKAKTTYWVELFILSFYLMTGNLNEELTFALPGISFFEIQPDRLLFLYFSFFLTRQLFQPQASNTGTREWKVPWFILMIFLYAAWIIISQISHLVDLGVEEVILSTIHCLTVIVLIYAMRRLADRQSLAVLGKAFIIGAVVTALVSIIQLVYDPMFLRIGDQRIAFGTVLRSNGLFNNEYCNAYFMITALAWTLISVRQQRMRFLLIAIFTLGVISSFQRMSWLILSLVLVIYVLKIEQIALEKLVLLSLCGLIGLVSIFIIFNREIMNSGLVKERLSEVPDSRLGYYRMVIDNIGKKPLFGYGGKNNELYYYSMLRITHERKRATGEEGDIHSGYFSSLFYYGVPGLIFFIAFVGLALLYFGQLYKQHIFFAVPFLLGLLYAIGNLTNTLLFSQYLSIIYAIHLGLGWGVRNMRTESLASLGN